MNLARGADVIKTRVNERAGLPDQGTLTQVYSHEQLGADILGLAHADFAPGAPADFVLVRGECLPQTVVDMPRRDMVVHGGRVVARDGELVGPGVSGP